MIQAAKVVVESRTFTWASSTRWKTSTRESRGSNANGVKRNFKDRVPLGGVPRRQSCVAGSVVSSVIFRGRLLGGANDDEEHDNDDEFHGVEDDVDPVSFFNIVDIIGDAFLKLVHEQLGISRKTRSNRHPPAGGHAVNENRAIIIIVAVERNERLKRIDYWSCKTELKTKQNNTETKHNNGRKQSERMIQDDQSERRTNFGANPCIENPRITNSWIAYSGITNEFRRTIVKFFLPESQGFVEFW